MIALVWCMVAALIGLAILLLTAEAFSNANRRIENILAGIDEAPEDAECEETA